MTRQTTLMRLATMCGVLGCAAGVLWAQSPHGRILYHAPTSSVEQSGDVGNNAHSDVLILQEPNDVAALPGRHNGPAQVGPPVAGTFYETPASVACLYQLVPGAGSVCNPNTTFANPTGGAGLIVVVDAYDDAHAASDLATFSTQFGLPAANLTVDYASGRRPDQDPTGGWELEESLDIEWAHALAPQAHIVLMEARSNSYSDLFAAVTAGNALLAANGGQLSMSWGGSEFSGETAYDAFFRTHNVVYFAAAGDAPGVDYPSASPAVVSAGGTSTNRNPFNGSFEVESAWQSSGGGPSAYEALPSYQNAVAATVGFATRSTPDVSFDSDPNTGVWVYDSTPLDDEAGWWIVGGTSVATASLAAIVNAANHHAANSAAELTTIYGGLGGSNFRDIQYSNCGPFGGFWAVSGWDFCTGVGSVLGLVGK